MWEHTILEYISFGTTHIWNRTGAVAPLPCCTCHPLPCCTCHPNMFERKYIIVLKPNHFCFVGQHRFGIYLMWEHTILEYISFGTTHISNNLSQPMFQTICPNPCFKQFVPTHVSNNLSQPMFQTICPNPCFKQFVPTYVSNNLSQPMFQTICPNTCFKQFVPTHVSNNLSQPMFQTICPNTCFKQFVPTHVSNNLSQHMCQGYSTVVNWNLSTLSPSNSENWLFDAIGKDTQKGKLISLPILILLLVGL
jgi:hypothetical protein